MVYAKVGPYTSLDGDCNLLARTDRNGPEIPWFVVRNVARDNARDISFHNAPVMLTIAYAYVG